MHTFIEFYLLIDQPDLSSARDISSLMEGREAKSSKTIGFSKCQYVHLDLSFEDRSVWLPKLYCFHIDDLPIKEKRDAGCHHTASFLNLKGLVNYTK